MRALLGALAGLLVLAPAAAAAPYDEAVTASAPAGWWRLGDAGPDAAPAAGAVTGQWSGAVTYGEAGAVDGDGDGAVRVSDDAALALPGAFAPTGALSAEGWFRLEDRGNSRDVVRQGGDSTGFRLYVTANGDPAFRVGTRSGSRTTTASDELDEGSWHHLAGTWDGATVRLYVDGVLAASRTTSRFRASTSALTVGRSSFSTSGGHNAGLDEVAVHARALTAEEIAARVDLARAAPLPAPAVAGPPRRTDARSAAFALAAAEPQARFQCSLNGAAFAPCPAAPSFDALPDGEYVLRVRAVDRWGRPSATEAVHDWTVDFRAAADYDPAPPETTITASIAEVTNRGEATFALNATKAVVAFSCSLDGGAWHECDAKHVVRVRPGAHELRVRATDRFLQTEETPAAFAWTVDQAAPETLLLAAGAPAPGSAGAAVFAATERVARFECRRDRGWEPCVAPVALPEGAAGLTVRAVDLAGNADPTPPEVRLTAVAGSPEPTGALAFASASAAVSFGAEGAAATFACRVDGGEWAACAAPLSLAGLPWGDHAVEVRASFPGGATLVTPPLGWAAVPPGTRVAALQLPVLMQRSRDGRARARGRLPTVRFALNVAAGVRLAVERADGSPVAAWGVQLAAGRHAVMVPDEVSRRLGRGRYRLVVTPAGGSPARRSFAVV